MGQHRPTKTGAWAAPKKTRNRHQRKNHPKTLPNQGKACVSAILWDDCVSIFLLALLLKVISPELDYLYENADRAAMRSIEFAIWTLPLLVIFWATYRRIRFEKR
jgi:hypothetical protein